jgi:twitching motility protein PilT
LRSLLLIDGEALVFRAGEMPHVLSPAGRVDLSDSALDRSSVSALIGELLPDEAQHALDAVGAAQHELQDLPEFPGERFNIIAASGANEVWIEVRRGYRVTPDHVRLPVASSTAPPISNGNGTHSPPVGAPRRELHVVPETGRRKDDVSVTADDRQELKWFVGQMRQRRATGLYLAAGERPSVRIDSRLEPLRDALPLTPAVIDGVWRAFVNAPDAVRIAEHICDVPELGSVRGHRSDSAQGVGVALIAERMRADLSPYLALPAAIRKLALERSGLILHTGPAGASGQRTLRAALVDVINRTRQAHVVVIERDVSIVHDRKASFVSQREVSAGTTVRGQVEAALREQPDVIVVEGEGDSHLIATLLDAATAGRLVICSLEGGDAAGALNSLVDLFDGDERVGIQRVLAATLKGVIAQVLVPRATGGRIAARELMLGSAGLLKAIAAGRLSQLPLLVADGRKDGMITLNDALLRLVESREVRVEDAMAAASDQEGLKEMLRRRGL